MEFAVGMVVIPKAGHDAGRYHVIVALEGSAAYLADGRRRKVAAPKRKNLRHLSRTGIILPLSELETDRKIRAALWPYQYGGVDAK